MDPTNDSARSASAPTGAQLPQSEVPQQVRRSLSPTNSYSPSFRTRIRQCYASRLRVLLMGIVCLIAIGLICAVVIAYSKETRTKTRWDLSKTPRALRRSSKDCDTHLRMSLSQKTNI